ncbi:MAG: hypothetical protein ABJB03_11460 [Rhodoglobus sp.]
MSSTTTTSTVTWNKPLLAVAVAMAGVTVFAAIAAFIDHREVLGAEVWLKPLKFAISVGVYSLTLAWLIGQLKRMRRVAWIAGLVAAIGLVIEMVIIVGVAAVGETSHFNVSTPFHTALWAIMAFSIVAVWVMTLVVAIALFRNPLGDAARTLAIRAGVVIAIAGMGLAFLMTGPTAQQLDDYQGIAGAHTVGVADGGPGLPLLGWSTVAGDLRIPHFVGMHALQALPILVILLELLARRVPLLRSVEVRLRIVVVGVAAYSATLGLLTWQALRGQSIVQPDAATLAVALVIAVASAAALLTVLVRRPAPVVTA